MGLIAAGAPRRATRTVPVVDARIVAAALPLFDRMLRENYADAGSLGDPKNFAAVIEDLGRNTVVQFILVGHPDIEGGGLQVTVDRVTLAIVESHYLK